MRLTYRPALLLLGLATPAALAQTASITDAQGRANQPISGVEQGITEVTFATLPVTNLYAGRKVTMTDGISGGGCTVGGGSIPKQCRWDGTAWKNQGVNPLEKNQPNGIPGLGSDAKVPAAQIPGANDSSPYIGSPTTLTTRYDIAFCIEGDSTHAGTVGAGTNPFSTYFAQTPVGKAWGVGANGTSNIFNFAVAGQNVSTILSRWSTSCGTIQPGMTINGAVITKVYFIFWSYWNNDTATGLTGQGGDHLWASWAQLNALAKANGDIVINETALTDPNIPNDSTASENIRRAFNAYVRNQRNFYQNTTAAACLALATPRCGYDYLDDIDALLPDLTMMLHTDAGDTYPLLGSDFRHPSNLAAQLQAQNLNNVILYGSDPKTLMPTSTFRTPKIGTGPTIASAASLSPQYQTQHVSGTTAITTLPVTATYNTTPTYGTITLIADAAWSMGTTGNIATAITATAGTAYTGWYDYSTSKWYFK